MRTTIAVDAELRNQLMALKRRWHCATLEEVISRLLEGPQRTAEELFRERQAVVLEVLRRHKLRRLIAFGSRARGQGRPDSDLDLAGPVPRSANLFDLVRIKNDLEDAFGMPVDFVPSNDARGALRREIERGVVLVA